MNNILAHALDHLALLKCADASINAVLEAGWLLVLETRLPKPAICISGLSRVIGGEGQVGSTQD